MKTKFIAGAMLFCFVAAPVFADIETGFDSGEGFVVDTIVGGQNDWTQFEASTTQPTISDDNPAGGDQHVRLADDPALADGSNVGPFSPLDVVDGNQESALSVMMFINDDNGADYDVVGQTPIEGFLSYRVKFNFAGAAGGQTISVLDDPGGTLAFQDTGVLWEQGVYRELRVVFDPANSQIEYFYDGNSIYVGNVFAGTRIEQVIFLSDNFQGLSNTPDASGDFDELSLVQSLEKGKCMFDLGDLDGNGAAALADIPLFVDLLATGGFQCEADINADGSVTLADIPLFVAILAGG